MKKKKKYYYFSYSSAMWWGIVVTILGVVLGWPNEGINWKWIVSMLLFLAGIAIIIIPPIINNNKEINAAYPNGLLNEAISDAIEASKQTQDKKWYVRKYEHYLREIIRRGMKNRE